MITTRRLLRWTLGSAVVLFISFLYPNNQKFPFTFERGQDWHYADLEAPYDIPILKPEEQLRADLAAVRERATPVYRFDQEIVREARADFLAEFKTKLDSAKARNQNLDLLAQPERHRRYGLEVIDKIYQRGIINVRSEDYRDQGMDHVITVVNGNEQHKVSLSNIFTPGDALVWLSDSLFYTDLKSPEFLLELLQDKFRHNIFYSDSLTVRLREQALDQVSPYNGLVKAGETIIRQGQPVTDDAFQKLMSYRKLYNEDLGGQATFWSVFWGFALQIALVVILLFYYVRTFFPQVYLRWKNLVFILLWPVLYALMMWAIDLSPEVNAYLVPFCIVPIVIRIFYGERLAFFIHVSVVLVASFLTPQGYSFTFLSIMAGVVVIVMDIDTRDMGRFFRSLLLLYAFYCVGYLGLELMRGGTWRTLDFNTLLWIAGNAFLVLLAYPLIPLLERIFGLISPITLVELSDMNRPLLERLARHAPGTLQHSLNVANMVEQAARAIGADALLVKTAALYHDIGKIENPEFFIENQNGPSPHQKLGPKESAAIIIGHVSAGIKLARQAGLPEVVIDFIRTHHGTTRAEYFFRAYLKDRSEDEVNDKDFRYPGPRPSTKEQTLLMIADSIEAGCKSLKNPTEEELFAFVDSIIRGKLTSGQLEESRLNFYELETCRDIFKGIIKSVYQMRIAYPTREEAPKVTPAAPPVVEEE